MTKHVHDYVIEGNVWRCRHCPGELSTPDVYIRIKATEMLKRWIGVMRTPAYGEWSEDKIGYWTRSAHIFGTPQVENMCREIVEAYADILEGT